MDPELLQQLFAQQDATANPPLESEGGSAGSLMDFMGMLLENTVLGQDPTGMSSLAQDPERAMPLVQLATGLAGPAIPAAQASKVLSRVTDLMSRVKPENLGDIIKLLIGDQDEIVGALHGATSEDLYSFAGNKVGTGTDRLQFAIDEVADVRDQYSNVFPKGPNTRMGQFGSDLPPAGVSDVVNQGRAIADLIDETGVAELAARSLVEGDPITMQKFSVLYGDRDIDFLLPALKRGGEIISETAEGARVYFPDFAESRLHSGHANAATAKLLLDLIK